MTRIGTLQGTYLGVYPGQGVRVLDGEAAEVELQVLLGRPEPRRRRRGRQVGGRGDGGRAAPPRASPGLTYVDFNTGHYEGETYLDILEPYIRRIKREVGILVGVQTPPHADLERYDALREMGVNRVSFCFEIFDPVPVQGGLPRQAPPVRPRALPGRRRLLRLARPARDHGTSRG